MIHYTVQAWHDNDWIWVTNPDPKDQTSRRVVSWTTQEEAEQAAQQLQTNFSKVRVIQLEDERHT